jgi:hypothetical protein
MHKKQKVLFVVLAIIGVLLTLQINGALAEETKSTKPLKCTYPAMTVGGFEVAGRGYGQFYLGLETTITVLEEITLPVRKQDGTIGSENFYRFDAAYDKPVMWCPLPGHGFESYELYSKGLTPAIMERFYLSVAEGTCK